jgi:hypothetical protein
MTRTWAVVCFWALFALAAYALFFVHPTARIVDVHVRLLADAVYRVAILLGLALPMVWLGKRIRNNAR